MSKLPHLNRTTYFLVKDPKASKTIAEALITSPSDSIILPFIDHPGPLSAQLLSRPFKTLTICDRDDVTRLSFDRYIKNNYPNRNVFIHSDDLFDLSYKSHIEEAQQRCRHIVAENLGVTSFARDCNFDGKVKFLVPLLKSKNEVGFLRNIYYQISLRLGLCSNTLLHYYFLMSDRQHAYLTAKPSVNLRLYRSSTVLYNTLFNLHNLHSFDLKDCYKISLKKLQKTSDATRGAYQKVHLIWMEPKISVLSALGPRSLLEFRFMVSQLMYKRRAPVISKLEDWFDGLDDGLDRLGIAESTRSGDMEIERYLELYRYLSSRPDYRNSTFLQAASQAEENIDSLP